MFTHYKIIVICSSIVIFDTGNSIKSTTQLIHIAKLLKTRFPEEEYEIVAYRITQSEIQIDQLLANDA